MANDVDLHKRILILERKLKREHLARLESEQLLENKSLELHYKNQHLAETNENLDHLVAVRTSELSLSKKQVEINAERLALSLQRLELVIQASQSVIWEWDIMSGNVSFTNYDLAESKLKNSFIYKVNSYEKFIALLHPEDHLATTTLIAKCVRNNERIFTKCRLRYNKYSYRWYQILGKEIVGTDSRHRYVGSITDINNNMEYQSTITHMAMTDSLTNISNRSHFNQSVNHLMSVRNDFNQSFSLVLIDLNNFKIVNDTHGHVVGDNLLIRVAGILKAQVKNHDLVARLGGDEFALFLNHANHNNNILQIVHNIIEACAQPAVIGSTSLSINLSIGVANFPKDASSLEELLRCADLAMYAAKNNKLTGSSFVQFTEELNKHRSRRNKIRECLRLALDANELTVHYQPCLNLHSGKIQTGEALVRWDSAPFNATVDEIISIAEESGLIFKLGDIVINHVFAFISTLEKLGFDHKIAINLSPLQILHQDIVSTIKQAAKHYDINFNHIQIEVTENVFLENLDLAVDSLNQLKHLGITVYLDDFGTGYSNLAYLKTLPLDWIKVDKSFVQGVYEDEVDLQICKSAINIAHSMSRMVVAEGVETKQQMEAMKSINCDVIQGYFISKPLPAEKYIDFLTSQRSDF